MEPTVNVRYMVDDVEKAVAWYTTQFGFTLLTSAAPAFADVKRGSLRLLLSGKTSSAGRPMPDGRQPSPGVGTGSSSPLTIWSKKLRICALPEACDLSTTSSRVPAVCKSLSKIHPVTWSNSSNPPPDSLRRKGNAQSQRLWRKRQYIQLQTAAMTTSTKA